MKERPTKPIRVILADDHPIVRAGIRDALKELPGVEVVGEASDGREAIELVKSAPRTWSSWIFPCPASMAWKQRSVSSKPFRRSG